MKEIGEVTTEQVTRKETENTVAQKQNYDCGAAQLVQVELKAPYKAN